MEFLFVKSFLEGEDKCLQVPWTDQMLAFFWEIVQQVFHDTYPNSTQSIDRGPWSNKLSISLTCDLIKYVLRSTSLDWKNPTNQWLLLMDLFSGCLQIREREDCLVDFFAINEVVTVTDPKAEVSFSRRIMPIVKNVGVTLPDYTRITAFFDYDPFLRAHIEIKGKEVRISIKYTYPLRDVAALSRPGPEYNFEIIWLSLGSQILGFFRIQYKASSVALQERIEEARRSLSDKIVTLI
jgi:hypothetical protein